MLCGYSHTTSRRMIPAYTKCDVQLIKLLLMMDLYSLKHVEHLMENKVKSQNFVHRVALYTYYTTKYLELEFEKLC